MDQEADYTETEVEDDYTAVFGAIAKLNEFRDDAVRALDSGAERIENQAMRIIRNMYATPPGGGPHQETMQNFAVDLGRNIVKVRAIEAIVPIIDARLGYLETNYHVWEGSEKSPDEVYRLASEWFAENGYAYPPPPREMTEDEYIAEFVRLTASPWWQERVDQVRLERMV